ncbi:hypothetical protein XHV734_3191 [Xanthomonas hortorum pv. vitians]|nr:hypothetical protein XHV734_3191 [Xanthomonas hortorum pv. vitians]
MAHARSSLSGVASQRSLQCRLRQAGGAHTHSRFLNKAEHVQAGAASPTSLTTRPKMLR